MISWFTELKKNKKFQTITLKMWQAEVLKGEGAHFQENTN